MPALVDNQFADSDPTAIHFVHGVLTVRASDLDPRDVKAGDIETAFERAAYDQGLRRFGRRRGDLVNDYVVDLRTLAPFVRGKGRL